MNQTEKNLLKLFFPFVILCQCRKSKIENMIVGHFQKSAEVPEWAQRVKSVNTVSGDRHTAPLMTVECRDLGQV